MKITKIRQVKTPTRAHHNDAGIDFYVPKLTSEFVEELKEKNPTGIWISDVPNRIRLQAESRILIPSGIKVAIPKNHALIFFNKSGVSSKKGLLVGGCVVDEHYSGEVHLSLFNPGDCEVLIYGDEKIVQGIILRVNYCDVEEISTEKYDELTSNFVRGEKGFGSSDEYQIKDNKNDNKKN